MLNIMLQNKNCAQHIILSQACINKSLHITEFYKVCYIREYLLMVSNLPYALLFTDCSIRVYRSFTTTRINVEILL